MRDHLRKSHQWTGEVTGALKKRQQEGLTVDAALRRIPQLNHAREQ